MLRTILDSLDIRLAELGKTLYQNYKLDYQQKVRYIKFLTLLGYRDILIKMENGTINYTHYSFDRERILETIKTQIATR
jgi:hypothetical protein